MYERIIEVSDYLGEISKTMLSIPFYLFYIFLAFCTPFFLVSKKYRFLSLLGLIFTAQFNVTCFLKIGMTISFFEISLFLNVLIILISSPTIIKKIVILKIDYVMILLLLFSLLSIFVAQIRISLGNLMPVSLAGEIPMFRSLMSLNKIIVFYPCFLIIRTFFLTVFKAEELKRYFLLFLLYSGILPCLSVLIQFMGIGFYVIKNNPSFSEIFHIVDFFVERPIGLTNEASFFVYQLFFPFVALIECFKRKFITKKCFVIILLFFVFSVILSLSRTGILIYSLYGIYKFMNKSISFSKVFKMALILITFFFIMKNITITGFNLYDRLLSSFNVEADLSTIERYGSSEAILNLIVDKGLIFGVGIFNYGFYVLNYLPDYMDVITHYDAEHGVPSFNFILQLVAEFGLPIFLIFMTLSIYYVRKSKDSFVIGWFLFLFVFCLSFQALNFSVPFLIFLYPALNDQNSLYN